MANKTIITIAHEESAAVIKQLYTPNAGAGMQSHLLANMLSNWLNAINCRDAVATIDLQVAGGDGTAASGTVTLSSLVANDTITVGTQVFTAKASPSGANQFALGASDTTAATNLAAAINAHTALTGAVTATSVGAVVTITCNTIGVIGNLIGIAISAHGTVSAATLATGANSSAQTYVFGRRPV